MTRGNHALFWKDMLAWSITEGEVKDVEDSRTADLIWIKVAEGKKLA